MFSEFFPQRSRKILTICVRFCVVLLSATCTASAQSSTSVAQARPAIIEAAESGDVKTVKKFFRQRLGKNQAERKALIDGALMSAAQGGHLDVIEVLLTAGADPNASNVSRHGGWDSPLICAMESKGDRLNVIDVLIAGGASVNGRRTYPPTLPPIYEAISQGDLPMLKALLVRGADVNFKFLNGIYPLMIAVTRMNLDMVKLLISSGADVNTKNDFGQTALSTATAEEYADEDIVRILQQAGAKP